MATCPKCKTFYLNDECPTCKRDRLTSFYEAAAAKVDAPVSGSEPVSPRRRNPAPVVEPEPEREEEQYPKPASARKKPPRAAMSMGGWAFFYTFLGILMCILAVLCLFLAYIKGFFVLLIGSMPVFCCGKLFKCITEILKNQVEILNLLDGEK
ncbi:MAG: hypothetical protein IJ313_05860 [Clostridia bacterium]|nr:hypothetical protein [Clostridia bacterium]